jgi:uncharacterized protein (UPF0332 family)
MIDMADAISAHHARILAALRRRSGREIRPPIAHELEFIRLTVNHGEYCEKLRRLGQHSAAESVAGNALYIGVRWLFLAQKHLEDARAAFATNRLRSLYSRSYYAAYNASKSVRFLVSGVVSLKGDDHARASELPDDFPSVARWSVAITRLYEHRLSADYDNWQDTASKLSLSAAESLQMATGFVDASCGYLRIKFGISI